MGLAQQPPGRECPKLEDGYEHLKINPNPWTEAPGGGVPSPLPDWTGQRLGLRSMDPGSLDRDFALTLQFEKPMPLLQSAGQTALGYLDRIVVTTNDWHQQFLSVAGGHPEPGGPGGGGVIPGPYLKAHTCEGTPDPACNMPDPSCSCASVQVEVGTLCANMPETAVSVLFTVEGVGKDRHGQ